MMTAYQRLQLKLVYLLVIIFITYFVLDICQVSLSNVAQGIFASVWSILLVLVDAKSLLASIRSSDKYPSDQGE